MDIVQQASTNTKDIILMQMSSAKHHHCHRFVWHIVINDVINMTSWRQVGEFLRLQSGVNDGHEQKEGVLCIFKYIRMA